MSLKFWPPSSGRLLGEELGVAWLRAVDVRARQHDELGDLELADVLEQLGEAGDVPRVVVGRRGARIVHDAEVDDGLDVAGAEDVLQLLAPDVDLGVVDVLGLVDEGSPVDADDAALAVKHAREVLAEPPADARDEDGARRSSWCGARAARSRCEGLGGTDGCALGHAVTRRCASAP